MSEEVPSRSAPKPPEGARLLRGDGDVDVGTPGRFGGGRLPEALGTDQKKGESMSCLASWADESGKILDGSGFTVSFLEGRKILEEFLCLCVL